MKAEELFTLFIPRIIENMEKIGIKIYDLHYERSEDGKSFLAIKVKNQSDNNPNNYVFYTCERIKEYELNNIEYKADKSINREAQLIINSDLTPEIISFFETLENSIDYHSTLSFISNGNLSLKKAFFGKFKN